MPIDFTSLSVLIPVATVAAAWGGAKAALNGTKNRVKDIEAQFELHKALSTGQHTDTVDRLARVETKLDILLTRQEH